MIEFALVLPLLLLTMIGILEVSLFFIQDNTLNKSVRESSRYLAKSMNSDGCYTKIAQEVVEVNMNNLFPSNHGNYTEGVNGTYAADKICVDDTNSSIVSTTAITGATCSVAGVTCASGSHLHVRVSVTYNATMLTGGLILPGMNINFSPTLSATSIMRVQ